MRKVVLIFALVILVPTAAAAQGTGFNFQGRLNDGSNPANGHYDLQFQLFDAIAGGNSIGSLISRPDTVLINGVFSTTLDFGSAAFNNPNTVFIEISLKPGGSPNAYTILGPRQQLTVVPFAARANDSAQLGGVAASEYITSTSNSFIKNSASAQSADFNISGDGLIGRRLGVGFGTFTDPGIALDVIGNSRFRSSSGGSVEVGAPNGETGVSISRGQGRGDIRFDGSQIRLVAGLATGPPSDTNGLSISTAGNVGIGAAAPLDTKLYVAGKVDVNGKLNVSDKLTVGGNLAQPAFQRGLPKALLSISPGIGTQFPAEILDCYNGVSGESFVASPLSTCGFQIRSAPDGSDRPIITFPFSLYSPGSFFSYFSMTGGEIPISVIENDGTELRVYTTRLFHLIIY